MKPRSWMRGLGALSCLLAWGAVRADTPTRDFVQHGVGAVQRSIADKLTETVSVRDFGAIGDGVTDDTAALQAAIDSSPAGGIVYLPRGSYRLRGVRSPLLAIRRPIILRGEGRRSILRVDAAVPADVDVLRVTAAPDGHEFMELSDFTIEPAAGRPARHALVIDTTREYVSNMRVQRLFLKAFGGRGIVVSNPTLTDGFFTSAIVDSCIYNGIQLQRSGDSVEIERNVIVGANAGVEVDMVPGARLLSISNNNITTSGGGIVIHSGAQIKILNNNIEHPQPTTEPNSVLIDIDGAPEHRVDSCELRGNFLGATTRKIADTVRVNYADQTVIAENEIIRSTGKSIRITPRATGTIVVANRFAPAGEKLTTAILDQGADTMIVSLNRGLNVGSLAVRSTSVSLQAGYDQADKELLRIEGPTGERWGAIGPRGKVQLLDVVAHRLEVLTPLQIAVVRASELGPPTPAGRVVYCRDCGAASTCAAGGTGHLAVAIGTAWACQ